MENTRLDYLVKRTKSKKNERHIHSTMEITKHQCSHLFPRGVKIYENLHETIVTEEV